MMEITLHAGKVESLEKQKGEHRVACDSVSRALECGPENIATPQNPTGHSNAAKGTDVTILIELPPALILYQLERKSHIVWFIPALP